MSDEEGFEGSNDSTEVGLIFVMIEDVLGVHDIVHSDQVILKRASNE